MLLLPNLEAAVQAEANRRGADVMFALFLNISLIHSLSLQLESESAQNSGDCDRIEARLNELSRI